MTELPNGLIPYCILDDFKLISGIKATRKLGL